MLQPGTVNVHFRFGVQLEIINIPQEHLIKNDSLYYISGYDNVAYENVYLLNNSHWVMASNYFKKWRLELWGNYEGKFQKLYRHDFNLAGKDVLFDLKPNNQYEADIWVEYLKFFEKKMNCNVSILSSPVYTQSQLPVVDNVTDNFYAGYLVDWSNNRMVNPYGNKFNAFDLINKRLLNI